MKISKSKLKKIIIEEIELASLQGEVDAIYDMISKQVDKIPLEAQGVIWSAIMSKIAQEAKSEDDIKEEEGQEEHPDGCGSYLVHIQQYRHHDHRRRRKRHCVVEWRSAGLQGFA